MLKVPRRSKDEHEKPPGSSEEPTRRSSSVALRVAPEIKLARVTLRFGEASDIESIVRFYTENWEYLGRFAAPINPNQLHSEFWVGRLEEMRRNFSDDKACNLFMVDSKGAIIGFINFFNAIRGAFHCCTVGYGLAERSQGKGLMTESPRAAIEYVFGSLNFHRIEANHEPNNIRSAKVLETLGFVKEGIAQEYLYISGVGKPHMRTALTNHKWKVT
jgi:ribosomal-protein-alanine N-acetyltransferase